MEPQLNLYQPLALFVPNSAGDGDALLGLTLQAVHQTFPFLTQLLRSIGVPPLSTTPIESFLSSRESKAASAELQTLFASYGSDKSTDRDYHHFYGHVLADRESIASVLEIGLGTNNLDVVSNMGAQGSPGASLRALRDFLPNARLYGADVDRRILFQDDRVHTFFVDQTDLRSFDALDKQIPDGLDLIIDDGLHAPNANVAVLSFGLQKLKQGGWLVIEDIPERAVPLWEVVHALLPPAFSGALVRARGGLLFAVQRRS